MATLGPILAIARKDLLLLMRDKGSAFFTFFFPMLIALFFGSIFNGGGPGGKLDIALVDQDHSPAAAAFAADLAADSALNVIQRLPSDQPLSETNGSDLVRQGAAVACVTIPQGFGEEAKNLLAGGSMRLGATIAPGRQAEAGLLSGKLNEIAFRQLSRTFTDPAAMRESLAKAKATIDQSPGLDPARKVLFSAMFSSMDALNAAQANPTPGSPAPAGAFEFKPVDVVLTTLTDTTRRPTSAWEISFPQGVVWGLMGCVMAFGTSMTSERVRGTLQRLTIAPIAKRDILAGKALACFVTCVLVQALLLGMAIAVFGIRPSNFAMMFACIGVTSAGFVGVMMLIAGFSRSEGGAQGLARALLLVLAMIGGGSVPTFFLPAIIQKVSLLSPFTWATRALEGALWRHYSWPEFALPAAVLLAVAAGGYLLGTLGLRWSENH